MHSVVHSSDIKMQCNVTDVARAVTATVQAKDWLHCSRRTERFLNAWHCFCSYWQIISRQVHRSNCNKWKKKKKTRLLLYAPVAEGPLTRRALPSCDDWVAQSLYVSRARALALRSTLPVLAFRWPRTFNNCGWPCALSIIPTFFSPTHMRFSGPAHHDFCIFLPTPGYSC